MGEGARAAQGAEGNDGAPQDNMVKLKAVLDRFEISIAEANDLVILSDYEIVVIADDSGSMQMASCPPHMRQLGVPCPTRWDELKDTCGLLAELGSCFDDSGLDFFFLNRPQVSGVKSAEDLNACFAKKPSGSTPLTEALRGVVQAYDGERPVLLFIMTDGEPNGGAAAFVQEVTRVVKKQSTTRNFKLQIMACTDDDEAVGWMNDLDEKFTEVDVCDDYHAEKAEVLKAGKCSCFTRGDWLIKAMLGPVSAKFDAWDEPSGKQGPGVATASASSCCVLM